MNAPFGNPVSKTEDADGNLLTADIVLSKDIMDVWDDSDVFSEIQAFLQRNKQCQTKIKMHYRDADALKNCLTNACENDDAECLTLEFQNRLPNNFATTANAEAALCGLNVATENNVTVRFQKVGKIDEDAVKAYFDRHTDVRIPRYFALSRSVKDVMKFSLNRTSDAPLTLIGYRGIL